MAPGGVPDMFISFFFFLLYRVCEPIASERKVLLSYFILHIYLPISFGTVSGSGEWAVFRESNRPYPAEFCLRTLGVTSKVGRT